MIQYLIDIEESQHRIIVEGHAGYNPGNDIVCAAASILVQTALQELYDLEVVGDVKNLNADLNPGKTTIKFETGNRWTRVVAHLSFLRNGFKMLEATYPEHVREGLSH